MMITMGQCTAGRRTALVAMMLAAALTVSGSHAWAAPLVLANGEPDPNCPDLRLWLRADSGIQDAEGRGPDDPNFNGTVAAWKDRSSHKFDLGSRPEQAPYFVARQPAAGNRPTVAFRGANLLARTGAVLHDRPASTVICVIEARPVPGGGTFFSCGKNPNSERLGLYCRAEVLDWTGGLYLSPQGVRDHRVSLDLPGDGFSESRFAAIISNGAGDRRTLEFHDGMPETAGVEFAASEGPLASDKCSRDVYLGGAEQEFFCGQIAEAIVFNRGLSFAERRGILTYLRRRYALDMTSPLMSDVVIRQADDFDGCWKFEASSRPEFARYLGNRHLTIESPLAGEGITTAIHVPRTGAYHVWLRAAENQGGLQTTIQGRDLGITHVRGPGNITWQEAGEIELQGGPAEIVIRGHGPGNKDFNALLVSPTAATRDQVEEICTLAQRIRRMGGESRLTAVFDNGLRLDGSLVKGWRSLDLAGRSARPDPAAMPSPLCIQFASRTEKPVGDFDSIVELHNGDRVRGAVGGYLPAENQAGKMTPARLLIRPPTGFFEKREQTLAVDVDWVRRIVFEASPQDRRCPPQTLICRNGRVYAFKAIRWGEQSLSLLTNDGVERIALNDVAEVRMPTVDGWDKYFCELSIIDPDGNAGIVRVETSEGMAITASTIRSAQLCVTGEAVARIRMLHPVWSREPIPVPWASTRLLWRAPPHVVPLSRFIPEQVVQRGTLGNSWTWQTDRNVVGGNLQSSGVQYLWGFGVHAPCTMAFRLPDCAKVFRSRVGIDSATGNSGCAVAKVYVNEANGQPLYQSKRLVGLDGAVVTGDIALPAASGGKRELVLVTESAGDLRADKGDPLDIGDHVDWLEPVLLLDSAILRAEVERHRPAVAQ